jgi:hypothetical protein
MKRVVFWVQLGERVLVRRVLGIRQYEWSDVVGIHFVTEEGLIRAADHLLAVFTLGNRRTFKVKINQKQASQLEVLLNDLGHSHLLREPKASMRESAD